MVKWDRYKLLDLCGWAGFVLLVLGVLGYDWRIAFVVAGVLLLALGVIGGMR